MSIKVKLEYEEVEKLVVKELKHGIKWREEDMFLHEVEYVAALYTVLEGYLNSSDFKAFIKKQKKKQKRGY